MLDTAAGPLLRRDGTRQLPASWRLPWLFVSVEPAFARSSSCRFVLLILFFTLCGLGAAASAAYAQTGRQVLLVVNAASPASAQIGEHYAKARGVPADQIIKLTLPLKDEISQTDYTTLIERPLAAWFAASGAQDRILYLVLTKGVPIRVAGSGGLQGTTASVDSQLTLLYRRMVGAPVPIQGRVANPYYLGTGEIAQAKPFTHEAHDIFLVSRLDGYTVEDVLRLIDRGKAPGSRGTFVLDQRVALLERANTWLETAADRLSALGLKDRVLLDATGRVVTNEKDVLGYYSWGSNDTAVKQRDFGLTFAPGALAAMFVSTDGRTFTAPPDTWQIGVWEKPETHYAGSPQSLAGDLIRAGVTGIAAHVGEPYLDATIRPEILFPAYVSGFNLIEAYYLAMPYLSWQTVVIGDPLCAPFPRTAPPQTSIEPPPDSISELPAFYSARRVQELLSQLKGVQPAPVRLLLRGDVRRARGDQAGYRLALEQVVASDPTIALAQMSLASVYESAGEYDKAMERYREVLKNVPNDVGALNNLAYGLAVHRGVPAEALPLAQRAFTASNGAPLVADTLGWIFHLTGDRMQALRYTQMAAEGAPRNGEVRYHYAAALANAGDSGRAAKELAAALELDPTLKTRRDVQAFQKTLAPSRQ
jgi:uncharacterized protein (TIGR03790 family)